MKKIAIMVTSLLLAGACVAASACGADIELVANDATDVLQEDFGIAVKKGDTEMKAAVDAVVDAWVKDGTMAKYLDYYTSLADESFTPTAPADLKLTWDLSGNTEVLDMYTESGFAPYEFVHSEGYAVSDGSGGGDAYNVAGIDVAIACQVAENLNCKLVIHDVEFDTIISHLNGAAGKAIAAAGLSITEERIAQVDFSNVYTSSVLCIVCDKEKGYNSLKQLDGLKIGVQEGTSGDIIASEANDTAGHSYETKDGETVNIKFTSPDTDVIHYKTYAAALAAIKSGKIDVIFMDKIPAQLLIKNA